jgi:RES domain-containing protein
MTVFRISSLKHITDLTGTGARLFGGRWNNKGVPCLYTADSRALALLEYTVNINIDDIPRALCLAEFQIPEANVLTIPIASLPGNWRESPAPAETKEFGTRLLQENKYPVIRIPSTVISQEYNYLLNPLHPQSKTFKLLKTYDLVYDLRIKTA